MKVARSAGLRRPDARRRHRAGLGPVAAAVDADSAHEHAVRQLPRREPPEGHRRPARWRRHDRRRRRGRPGRDAQQVRHQPEAERRLRAVPLRPDHPDPGRHGAQGDGHELGVRQLAGADGRERHAPGRGARDDRRRATAAARPARSTTSRTSPATAGRATATRSRSRSWPTVSATPTTCTRSRPRWPRRSRTTTADRGRPPLGEERPQLRASPSRPAAPAAPPRRAPAPRGARPARAWSPRSRRRRRSRSCATPTR